MKKEKKRYKSLLGKYSWLKGYHAEFLILERLLRARKNNELLKSITRFLPADFEFCDFSQVWKYHSSPEYSRVFSVDIFARSVNADDYSIIGEVKNREIKAVCCLMRTDCPKPRQNGKVFIISVFGDIQDPKFAKIPQT